jgi:hypothetical protein
MRHFEAQRAAAVAHRDRMLAQQAQMNAQNQAIAGASVQMQALAAQMPPPPSAMPMQAAGAAGGAVLPPMGPGTVTHHPQTPPETATLAAPPATPNPGETTKAARKPRTPRAAKAPPAAEHVNGSGRAGSDH